MTTSVSPRVPSNMMTYSPMPVNTRMYRKTHFATLRKSFRANDFFLRISTIVTMVNAAAMPTHITDPQIGAGLGICAIMMPAARMQEMTVPIMHAMTGELFVSPA